MREREEALRLCKEAGFRWAIDGDGDSVLIDKYASLIRLARRADKPSAEPVKIEGTENTGNLVLHTMRPTPDPELVRLLEEAREEILFWPPHGRPDRLPNKTKAIIERIDAKLAEVKR